jgi:hypothetical protein
MKGELRVVPIFPVLVRLRLREDTLTLGAYERNDIDFIFAHLTKLVCETRVAEANGFFKPPTEDGVYSYAHKFYFPNQR